MLRVKSQVTLELISSESRFKCARSICFAIWELIPETFLVVVPCDTITRRENSQLEDGGKQIARTGTETETKHQVG